MGGNFYYAHLVRQRQKNKIEEGHGGTTIKMTDAKMQSLQPSAYHWFGSLHTDGLSGTLHVWHAARLSTCCACHVRSIKLPEARNEGAEARKGTSRTCSFLHLPQASRAKNPFLPFTPLPSYPTNVMFTREASALCFPLNCRHAQLQTVLCV